MKRFTTTGCRSPTKSKIAQMVFGGFDRCLYPVQKFQSDTERVLSVILDLLIPHDAIAENMTMQGLAAQFAAN